MPTFLLTLNRVGNLTSDEFHDIPDIENEIRRIVEPAGELRAIYWVEEPDNWSPYAVVYTPVILRMAAIRSDLEGTGRFVLRDVLRLWEAPEFKHSHGEPVSPQPPHPGRVELLGWSAPDCHYALSQAPTDSPSPPWAGPRMRDGCDHCDSHEPDHRSAHLMFGPSQGSDPLRAWYYGLC